MADIIPHKSCDQEPAHNTSAQTILSECGLAPSFPGSRPKVSCPVVFLNPAISLQSCTPKRKKYRHSFYLRGSNTRPHTISSNFWAFVFLPFFLMLFLKQDLLNRKKTFPGLSCLMWQPCPSQKK